MGSLLTALRRAARRLAKAPTFSLTAVTTLGAGIGATAAVFALVDAVLLRPLPYSGSHRLVAVQHAAPGLGVTAGGLSEGTYLFYRQHNRVFDEVGLYLENDLVSITDGDEPERVRVAMVTPSLFSTLRVKPFLGRPFVARDGGVPCEVMISYDLWARRYAADPGVVARPIELNRGACIVVGVLPRDFAFPRPSTQVWYNMPVTATRAGIRDLHRGGVARLRPGVSPEEAAADLQRLIPMLPESYGDVTPDLLRSAGLRAVVAPLKDVVIGDVRRPVVLLAWTASFVLLIAWANLANLFLVRAEHQRREVAVERALGATGRDLARRFIGESTLLAVLGAAVGLALAHAGVRWRFGFEPGQIPRLHEVALGPGVLAFALGVALLSATVLGVASLARAARTDPNGALKVGAGRTTPSRQWQATQRSLAALQLALAFALLVGSALMVRSYWRLKDAELGFAPAGLLTVEVSLPYDPYPTYQAAAGFHHRLLDQLRNAPGVTAAEVTTGVPLTPTPSFIVEPIRAEEESRAGDDAPPAAVVSFATPGYFGAMAVPVRRGRGFQEGDLRGETIPVVISQSLARALFPGRDPIGKRVRFVKYPRYPWYTVVGVAGDVPGEAIPAGPANLLYFPILDDLRNAPEVDVPIPYVPREMVTLVVRTAIAPSALASVVRREVRRLDPKVPITQVRTMDQIVAASTARTRLTTFLLLVAAATALFLGVVGIYGVLSYGVSQRTSELGVRLALGATPADVKRLVLRQGAVVALVGIGAGLAAAFALTRLLSSLLFEVTPNDPLAFAMTAVMLFVVAITASYLPARRAGHTDVVRAINGE